MKQAIAYIRVSTEGQRESGFGMDAQGAQIEAFAQQTGYNVKKTICESASARGEGNASERNGLQEAISIARRNKWPIIVASLDQLAREPRR